MIDAIENLMLERLEKGLGQLVTQVASYGGELDMDIANAIRTVPAAWVTYGGSGIVKRATSGSRYQNSGKFIAMVATRSVRSEASRRKGGADTREIGIYQLIAAVRRLLDGQGLSLGLTYGLQPKQVRTIFNHQNIGGSPLSVYAIEYEAVWNDVRPLDDGRYPEQTTDINDPDHIFTKYRGQLSPPHPDLLTVKGELFDPTTRASNPINIYLRGHNEAD